MDNLTHSLVGALLGQMGLKRRTGLAMPTLIIAANIPDIDAGFTVLGMVSLAMRRGVTHEPFPATGVDWRDDRLREVADAARHAASRSCTAATQTDGAE